MRTMDEGAWGEERAHRYLLRRGWHPVARNWRGGGGELDVVMRRRGVLAVVEVKTRSDPAELEDPISYLQRARLVRAANALVEGRRELQGLTVRFDLMTVDSSRRPPTIRHRRDVIDPEDLRIAGAPRHRGMRPS